MKNLPRAIAISCTLVTVVYVLANISFYTILSPEEVLGSSAVAVTFAERAFGMFAWTIPGTFYIVVVLIIMINDIIFVRELSGNDKSFWVELRLFRETNL